jgi:hypothetical protein
VNIGDWLRGAGKSDGGKAQPALSPQVEQLEPRLLLNADSVGVGPWFALDAPHTQHAIFVDLDDEPAYDQAKISNVLAEPDACCLIAPSVDLVQDRSESDDEASGVTSAPIDANGSPDVNAGSEAAITNGQLVQVAYAAVERAADPAAASLRDSDGSVAGYRHNVISTREASAIEITGPPVVETETPYERNRTEHTDLRDEGGPSVEIVGSALNDAFPASGVLALTLIGTEVETVATRYGWTAESLSARLLSDETLHVDATGALFYADPPPSPMGDVDSASSETEASLIPQAGPYSYDDTFLLHSFPTASRVIYLDFDGHTTPAGTAWNDGNAIVSAPFDTDGDPSSFSSAEQDTIQRIWQQVAEDYIPFDIDVTTEDPGDAGLTRADPSDQHYGVRVVISPSSAWYGSFGGAAYLDVFDLIGDFYKPCFVFSDQLSNGEKNIAEAASHEVGHTLGLSHDGAGATEYYPGHGSGATGWSTIMGLGYYKPVVQWSQGEYLDATNTEDDLNIITTRNGFGYRADDHGNTAVAASPLGVSGGTNVTGQGIIERTADVDFFSFSTGTGLASISIRPFVLGPNLDIKAALYDSAGTILLTSDFADTLGASFSTMLVAGTYYISIDGTGWGEPLNDPPTGYTEYGSLGQYSIRGTIDGPAWDIDGNGTYDALTDGLLVLRYLFGFQPPELCEDAIGPGATRTCAEIEEYLDSMADLMILDIDGNGAQDALTDGILLIRYLFGFRSPELCEDAIGPGATRICTEIEDYIESYIT